MNNWERDKLRAEIAGRVLPSIIQRSRFTTSAAVAADEALEYVDALLDRLGLSEEAEAAAIRKMADELRAGP